MALTDSMQHLLFCGDEQQTFKEALGCPDSKQWEQAAMIEYNSIEELIND
jgi:hypothetical protein